MKLKPVKKMVKPVENLQKPMKKEKSKLPSDTYKPMFEPVRFLVSDSPSNSNPTQRVKKYIEISVKRFEDLGLPYVFLQMYQEAEIYTGYLKGKSIHLPLEMLYTLLENLEGVDQICDKLGIE